MVVPTEFIPGFVSPLTDEQHAQIGRIAVLWGQIEHFVEVLMPQVSGFGWSELEALGIASKTIASKADFLRKAKFRLKDTDTAGGFRCVLYFDTRYENLKKSCISRYMGMAWEYQV